MALTYKARKQLRRLARAGVTPRPSRIRVREEWEGSATGWRAELRARLLREVRK